jgi:hypothetical protein
VLLLLLVDAQWSCVACTACAGMGCTDEMAGGLVLLFVMTDPVRPVAEVAAAAVIPEADAGLVPLLALAGTATPITTLPATGGRAAMSAACACALLLCRVSGGSQRQEGGQRACGVSQAPWDRKARGHTRTTPDVGGACACECQLPPRRPRFVAPRSASCVCRCGECAGCATLRRPAVAQPAEQRSVKIAENRGNVNFGSA